MEGTHPVFSNVKFCSTLIRVFWLACRSDHELRGLEVFNLMSNFAASLLQSDIEVDLLYLRR